MQKKKQHVKLDTHVFHPMPSGVILFCQWPAVAQPQGGASHSNPVVIKTKLTSQGE
jgi:hypothetical protein